MFKQIFAGVTMLASVAVLTVSMQTSKAEAGVRLYVQPPAPYYGSDYYYPRSYTHRPYYNGYRRSYRWGNRHCHKRWRNGRRITRCHRHKIYY